MKINIFNWAYEEKCSEALVSLGFTHNETLEIDDADLLPLVSDFFELGVNVMISHAPKTSEYDVLIALDTRRFSQR